MLFWAAVINGVVAVPIMIAMMLVIGKGKGLGSLTIPAWMRGLGWAAAALMALTVVALDWVEPIAPPPRPSGFERYPPHPRPLLG